MKNINKYYLILGFSIISLILFGSTLAILLWRSNNTNITITSDCFTINYSKGQDINNANLGLIDENNFVVNNNITITEGMALTTASIGIKSTCNIEGYGILKLNVENISPAFTTGDSKGSLKYAVVNYDPNTYSDVSVSNLSGVSFAILSSGSIESSETITLVMEQLSNSEVKNYLVIIYIDGNKTGNDVIGSNFNGNISAEANQGEVPTAAVVIRNLYNPDGNTKPTVNNITYNLDTTNKLVKDVGGNIRYYGADDPEIDDDLNNYIYFNCETYPSTNCERWRIIGVFDDKIKIMYNGVLGQYSWDTSVSTVNDGNGINEWSQADLMKLLNPDYENNTDLNSSGSTITVNNSLYWTGIDVDGDESETYYCYNNLNNGVGTCGDLRSKGLKNDKTRNFVSEHIWSLKTFSSSSVYADAAYTFETSTGTVIESPADDVIRKTEWPGRIALPSSSDFGYGVNLFLCQTNLYSYDNDVCRSNNWIKSIFGNNQIWLLNSRLSGESVIFRITATGYLASAYASYAYGVVPTLYLNSDTFIIDGIGSFNNPYQIG